MAEYISFQPSDFFNTLLYTGDGVAIGSGGQAITGVGFQPDMVWAKQRSGTEKHDICDSARGTTKTVTPNSNAAEVTDTETLTTFGADGFTVGNSGSWNNNTSTYVSWNWKAATTSGIATNGSTTITPSAYSFNQTSGFSILKYTGNDTAGAKLAHGLGTVPKMVIIKGLTGSPNWNVYHVGMGNTKYIELDGLAAAVTSTTRWNDTTPDSVNITLGTSTHVNDSSNTFIAYCFADVKGYSQLGTYGSTDDVDGPFIYTGFRPAYTMIKESSGSNPWVVDDVKREPINEMEKPLKPNNTDGTYSGSAYGIDFVSNGFKIRNSDSTYNGVTKTYIYAAFAEFPIVSSNDVPTVAR